MFTEILLKSCYLERNFQNTVRTVVTAKTLAGKKDTLKAFFSHRYYVRENIYPRWIDSRSSVVSAYRVPGDLL